MTARRHRIAVGGFQHETNTFAPIRASWDDFVMADGWPGLSRGAALPLAVSGMNLPAAGAIAELERRKHDCVPLSWASASPSAYVTEDAFERFSALLLEDLAKAGPLDGVYLDLHGAM